MSPARPATSASTATPSPGRPRAGEVFWYRIYRSERRAIFQPGPDTFLTYVEKGTTRFRDASEDFVGEKLQGSFSYRVTAVSKDDWESPPTEAVKDDRSAVLPEEEPQVVPGVRAILRLAIALTPTLSRRESP